jgi:hypothetical protein
LEVVMTGPDQPVPRSEDTEEPTDERQRSGRVSLSPRKNGWLWVTVSVIAFVGVSAVLIAVLIGIGTHQAKLSGPSVGAAPGTTAASGGGAVRAAPTGTSKTKNTVIPAARLAEDAGALRLPKSVESPAIRWQLGPGGTRLAALSRLFGDALQAGGLQQYPEMKSDCTQLTGSAAAAQAGPKIPDAAMQALYARALAELARGAADCRAAINLYGDESVEAHVDAALLHLSMSELAVGARDLFRATAEIEIVSRQHY